MNFSTAEPIFMKFGMHIMAPETISTAYFLNRSYQYVSIYMSSIFARQRLDQNATMVMNTQNKRIVRDVVFMRSVSYQREAGD
jgi:hypothetical protein